MAVACLGISGDILIRLIYELRPLPEQSLVVHGYGRAGLHQGTPGRQSLPSITNQLQVEEETCARGEGLNEKRGDEEEREKMPAMTSVAESRRS